MRARKRRPQVADRKPAAGGHDCNRRVIDHATQPETGPEPFDADGDLTLILDHVQWENRLRVGSSIRSSGYLLLAWTFHVIAAIGASAAARI